MGKIKKDITGKFNLPRQVLLLNNKNVKTLPSEVIRAMFANKQQPEQHLQ